MKIYISVMLISFSFIAQGQEIKQEPIAKWRPLYYLDSVIIEPGFYFDPNKIADMNVVGNYYDSSRQIHGKVFLTSKAPKSYKFLTITDITSTYKKGIQTPTIFMVDNDFLTGTTNFKIDSSYILKVELTSTAEINYLKNAIPELTILKIITRTKENLDRQKQIRIRGIQSTISACPSGNTSKADGDGPKFIARYQKPPILFRRSVGTSNSLCCIIICNDDPGTFIF